MCTGFGLEIFQRSGTPIFSQAVKYGDITGLLTLGAPGQLMLADPDPQLRDRVTKTYQAAGKSNALKVSETFSTDGADWISFLLQ